MKVGDYVKLKKELDYCEWYHTNPMKIIKIIDDELFIDYPYREIKAFLSRYCYQDYECIKKLRNKKFKKILNE